MSAINISSDYFENVKNRDIVTLCLKNINQWEYNINSMKNASITGTESIEVQLNSFKDLYTNLLNKLDEAIYNVEQTAQYFALCVLFDNNRKVYINRRKNPKKDFCDYYQVTGGKLEPNESYENCAIREAEEEAGVKVEGILYVALDKYIDKTTGNLFECAIYIGYIGKQIPENKEPENHDNWELIELKKLKTYNLTSSLVTYYEDIKKSIQNYRFSKKRKLEEFIKLEDVDITKPENIKLEDVKLENEINNAVEVEF